MTDCGTRARLLGIALTALSVAVVRSWLQLAANKAIEARQDSADRASRRAIDRR